MKIRRISSIHYQEGFDRAKTESEPDFCSRVRSRGWFQGYKVLNVEPGTAGEDVSHIDVKLTVETGDGGQKILHVDVKDKENLKTDNYSVSAHEYDDIGGNFEGKYEDHWLAMAEYERLQDGSHRKTGRFIICPTLEAYGHMYPKFNYYLLPTSWIKTYY